MHTPPARDERGPHHEPVAHATKGEPVNYREKTWNNGWPLERVLFTMAGTIILVSVALALLVSPWFLALTAFVGVNQLLYASVGFCGASLVLGKLVGFEPACATKEARA